VVENKTEYESIIYDTPEEGIARITLNRPDQSNAMSRGLISEVYHAAHFAADDDDIAVIIYRGNGKSFCAGRDFKEVAKFEKENHDGTASWRNGVWSGWGQETWLSPKATIAQVHGYALGGGEWLAAFCDITVASDDAILGFPEGRWGILSGGWHHWNWLIGPKQVKEYILTGRNLTATEAYEAGLVNHVVTRDELEEKVMGIARDIVANERRTPGFVESNKGAINATQRGLTNAALRFSAVPTLGGMKLQQAERQLAESTAAFQAEFQRTVADEGMAAGLALMHKGNESRF